MTPADSPAVQPGLLAQRTIGPRQLRAELEDLVAKELLGPRGGPDEEVTESRLQDRYLAGMLAPKNKLIRAAEMGVLADDGEGSVEEGETDDSALPVDSLYPSSIGLTCTIHSESRQILVTARWGRYAREKSETATTPQGNPTTVWKRYPMGNVGKVIPLVEGDIAPIPIDPNQPEVFLQGLVRRLEGDWIVSLFLVNGQQETERLKDEAWIFQPELEVRSPDGAAIFRRRNWLRDAAKLDPVQHAEQQALEMLYRDQVEFAIGHGVAVHAETRAEAPTHAIAVITRVMPTYEVPVTTPPTAEDVPALADLVLDMKTLAEMNEADLLRTLRVVPVAYKAWIAKERTRIENPAEGLGPYKQVAIDAMNACDLACARIEAGVNLLAGDAKALRAFRFANEAMWHQRVHSLVAEAKRAGRAATLEAIDVPENRSWRPFQLAFIILNLPGVTLLDHPERSDSPSAVADLLWFPTGGGKTEAYLGLTAYTLATRRLQGTVEGRLGHVGVAVIMRYTLRLLTLQQFQRASALICACEVIRRADAETWGAEPFRVGLWVGQKTTPNTIDDAHHSILQGRGAGAGSGTGSPLQLTNCPWCGSNLEPGRDVKVETFQQGRARVLTYCSDSLGQCAFSRSKAPEEGIPVVTVDEEIYRRLPSLLIATVDKFAQMPWNGKTQMLFGQVTGFCPRHGFRSPCIEDSDSHPPKNSLPRVQTVEHGPVRPPDLIIQDELHLISGPLGSLVGLYETAVDQLCTMGNLKGLEEYSDDQIWAAIEAHRSDSGPPEQSADLKTPEWEIFTAADPARNNKDFLLRPVAAPRGFETCFEKVVMVERLREVRALTAFTRIESPGDFSDPSEIPAALKAPICRGAPHWVPVSEVRGEGVFLQFSDEAIREWCKRVRDREAEFRQAHFAWRRTRRIPNPAAGYPGIRYALIHSFSHALMRQLSMEAGYTAASIRERIYANDGDGDLPAMAGLLLYTAAPDSEGTLGGLVSLGEPDKLGRLVTLALEQIKLCASDPLCAEHHPTKDGIVSLHGAACHACMFSPETSCERGNKYLDRSLLIAAMGSPVSPFFGQTE